MLIAVDGFEASANARVGVGRFEVELLKAIHKIVEARHAASLQKNIKHCSFRIYVPGNIGSNLPKESNNWQYRQCSFNRLWSQLAIPFYLTIDKPKPDVFFAPIHYAPRFCPAPLVLGIMDLSFLHFPEMFKKRDLYKLRNWTAYSVRKARRIITISQSTKDDIIKKYQIEAGRIAVVYPGIKLNENLKMKNEELKFQISNLKKKYGVEEDYILYVGTLQPRKNLVRLIEAFISVNSRQQTVNGKKKLKLVIAGKKGWMYEEIFKKVKELNLEKEVVFTGYVPDEELPILYKGAKCFALVSLYEGFGFPVLEAMSMGVPVVCSNSSSLPEVAGEAAILVDPKNVEDIKGGIEKILGMSDEEIERLRSQGIKQASKFTWEKTARQTLEILEEVGKKLVINNE